MSGIRFRMTDWAAWAPGLSEPGQWRQWAHAPFLPQGEAQPELSQVPAMQRRRIDPLGRCAITVADACRRPGDAGAPLVFVSRHGDLARSLRLLQSLQAGTGLSPTQFGLSVHNAVAAQYSQLRQERGNYTALAAGMAGIEAGLIECAGLLGSGAATVTLVACEDHVPEVYRAYQDEPSLRFGLALRLLPGTAAEGVGFSLAWTEDEAEAADAAADAPADATVPLPHALQALRFLIGTDKTWRHAVADRCWHWRRHA